MLPGAAVYMAAGDVRYYLLRPLKVTVEIRSIKACDGKLMVGLPAPLNNGY